MTQRRYKPPIPQERTFAIFKPGVVSRDTARFAFNRMLNSNVLGLTASRRHTFTTEEAATFYQEHAGKPFYDGLIAHMTSGLSILMVLEGPNAIQDWRKLMGPTDPERAGSTDPNSLRARYGRELPDNGFHGSDSPEAATREIAMFFPELPA